MWQSWRIHYLRNQDYYNRQIKQYQKEHRILDSESNPTILSKPRHKQDIESNLADIEVAPQKRWKIGGERSVKPISVSGMIHDPLDLDPI